jgi:hypothetical protein
MAQNSAMKFLSSLSAFLAAIIAISDSVASGQSPPVPAPTPGTRRLQNYATAIIAFPGTEPATARAYDGRFEVIGIRIHETADIDVQFPGNPATTAPSVQALDGGIITGKTKAKTAETDGITSFKFHAPGKPGLYRVLIASSTGPFTLLFWITDRANPGNKRPVVNPAH